MDTPVIELDGVVRRFDEVTALAGVDLQVRAGEVVGLLGHNGAGKTTTVRTIAGVLPPDDGTVRVLGMDPATDGPAVRRRLGVLPARPIVDERLTAAANLRFAADLFGLAPDDTDARIAAALARFDLTDRADEPVSGFSTGMRQRLSLARVLLSDPDVLLLDEPTSALDPVAARQVRDLLAELARGQRRTIVICTHDLTEAEQLCDRLVVLERGRVVVAGTPAELRAEHGQAGLRVRVPPADVDRAARLLQERLGLDVAATGDAIDTTIQGDDATAAVVRTLVEADIQVLEARREQTSLEDVYLHLHAQQSAADLAQVPPVAGGAR